MMPASSDPNAGTSPVMRFKNRRAAAGRRAGWSTARRHGTNWSHQNRLVAPLIDRDRRHVAKRRASRQTKDAREGGKGRKGKSFHSSSPFEVQAAAFVNSHFHGYFRM